MLQISKKLGENIKRIRLRRKMSQGDICRAIGMDRSYMSAIEGGKVNVTLAILEKLAKALDVSVDELLKHKMFILIYKFPLPKIKLGSYLKIDKKADAIYREHGLVPAFKIPYLYRKLDAKNVEVLLFSCYKSKSEYKKRIKLIDKDPRIIKLFNQVLKTVPRRKIKTFEYETL
jgi:transcriptional regulator with XRE-family HTH domain